MSISISLGGHYEETTCFSTCGIDAVAACGTNPPAVTDPLTDPITDVPETEAPITEPASVTLAKGYIDGIDARVAAILTTSTAVTYTGTAYYVAADGDDTADGLTPETA